MILAKTYFHLFLFFVAAEQNSRIYYFLKPQSSSCNKQQNESLVQPNLVRNGSFPRVVITVRRRGWIGDNHLLLAEGAGGGGGRAASKTAKWNGGGGHGKRGEEAKRFMKEFAQIRASQHPHLLRPSDSALLSFLWWHERISSMLQIPCCTVTLFNRFCLSPL